jgi:hypothetical protein
MISNVVPILVLWRLKLLEISENTNSAPQSYARPRNLCGTVSKIAKNIPLSDLMQQNEINFNMKYTSFANRAYEVKGDRAAFQSPARFQIHKSHGGMNQIQKQGRQADACMLVFL